MWFWRFHPRAPWSCHFGSLSAQYTMVGHVVVSSALLVVARKPKEEKILVSWYLEEHAPVILLHLSRRLAKLPQSPKDTVSWGQGL